MQAQLRLKARAPAKVEGILLVVRRPPLVQIAAAGHADTVQRVGGPMEAPRIQPAPL